MHHPSPLENSIKNLLVLRIYSQQDSPRNALTDSQTLKCQSHKKICWHTHHTQIETILVLVLTLLLFPPLFWQTIWCKFQTMFSLQTPNQVYTDVTLGWERNPSMSVRKSVRVCESERESVWVCEWERERERKEKEKSKLLCLNSSEGVWPTFTGCRAEKSSKHLTKLKLKKIDNSVEI